MAVTGFPTVVPAAAFSSMCRVVVPSGKAGGSVSHRVGGGCGGLLACGGCVVVAGGGRNAMSDVGRCGGVGRFRHAGDNVQVCSVEVCPRPLDVGDLPVGVGEGRFDSFSCVWLIGRQGYGSWLVDVRHLHRDVGGGP